MILRAGTRHGPYAIRYASFVQRSPCMHHNSTGIPDFLAIGHVTRDIHQDGSFSLGGTVTFASLCASSLGLAAGVVTCADEELRAQLPTLLPNVAQHICSSEKTTTFANIYRAGFRTQYLHARAETLRLDDVPT